MHYRTQRVGFLEPADAFLERMPHVHRLDEVAFDTGALLELSAAPDGGASSADAPLAVVPAVP